MHSSKENVSRISDNSRRVLCAVAGPTHRNLMIWCDSLRYGSSRASGKHTAHVLSIAKVVPHAPERARWARKRGKRSPLHNHRDLSYSFIPVHVVIACPEREFNIWKSCRSFLQQGGLCSVEPHLAKYMPHTMTQSLWESWMASMTEIYRTWPKRASGMYPPLPAKLVISCSPLKMCTKASKEDALFRQLLQGLIYTFNYW